MHQRLLAAAAFVVAAGSATAAPITYDFSGSVNLVRGVPGQGNALVDQLSAIGIGSTFGGSITLDTALGTPGASIPNGTALNNAITGFTIVGFPGLLPTASSSTIQHGASGHDLLSLAASNPSAGYSLTVTLESDVPGLLGSTDWAQSPQLSFLDPSGSKIDLLVGGTLGEVTASLASFQLRPGPTAAVPEPTTLSLVGAGLVGAGLLRRRRTAAEAAARRRGVALRGRGRRLRRPAAARRGVNRSSRPRI